MNSLKITPALNKTHTQKINFSSRDDMRCKPIPDMESDEFKQRKERKKAILTAISRIIRKSSTDKPLPAETCLPPEQTTDSVAKDEEKGEGPSEIEQLREEVRRLRENQSEMSQEIARLKRGSSACTYSIPEVY